MDKTYTRRTLMVNFGLNSAVVYLLAVAGAGLYFLRSVRPELSRDHDIFFRCHRFTLRLHSPVPRLAADPILIWSAPPEWISYFLLLKVFGCGVATEQAKRNTPIVDEDRPVSRGRK